MGRGVRRALVAGGLALMAAGCSDESGDRDLAGAVTGPGVEVHCAGQQRRANLERFPSTIGDTSVDVACEGAQ